MRKLIETGERNHQRILGFDRMKEFDIVDGMNPPKRFIWAQADA